MRPKEGLAVVKTLLWMRRIDREEDRPAPLKLRPCREDFSADDWVRNNTVAILMLYGDESSGTSETIGDFYSTSTRLCCEDSMIKASSIGNLFDGPTADVLRRLSPGLFSIVWKQEQGRMGLLATPPFQQLAFALFPDRLEPLLHL
jgi:hypothetical protein